MNTRRSTLTLLLVLLLARISGGQEHPRSQLLKLVPDDFGFAFLTQDLREQFGRWEKSAWLKKLRASPLVQGMLGSEELRDLIKMKEEMHAFFDIDWPTLRDDVLGDAVVFAFRPAVKD